MWLFPYRCSPASGPMSLHPRYPSFFLPGRITSPIWATKKEGQQWTLQRQLKGIQHVPVRPSSCLSYIKLSLCLLWTQPLLSLFQSMRDYLMSSFSSFRSLSETSKTSIECSADHPAFSLRFSVLSAKPKSFPFLPHSVSFSLLHFFKPVFILRILDERQNLLQRCPELVKIAIRYGCRGNQVNLIIWHQRMNPHILFYTHSTHTSP